MVAVRRNTCMCITVSEIRYQTWVKKYDELIITTSQIKADRHDIATLLRGQTAWKTIKNQQHLVGTVPISNLKS